MRALDAQRTNRLPSVGVLLLAAAIALSVVAPPASANQYKVVEVCKRSHDGLTVQDEPLFTDEPLPSRGFHAVDRCQADGSIELAAEGDTLVRGMAWVLRAPADTRIRGMEYDRVAHGPWAPQLRWEVVTEKFGGENFFITPPSSRVVHETNIDTTFFKGRLICEVRTQCQGGQGQVASVQASNITLTLEDEFEPQFTAPLGGSLVSDELLRGVEEVTYAAEDRGSGVAGAFLVVDEVPHPVVPDLNGGLCEAPYTVLVPCRLQARSSVPLDTRSLSEGFHEVEVVLVDAAGNQEESEPVFVFVHNAPISLDSPVIKGSPQVGSTLSVNTGTWLGNPSSFSYQWLRCPPQAERVIDCAPVIGATGTTFTPNRLDLNYRELVIVTAVNSSGSESTFSGATEVVGGDSDPPVLRNVRLSRRQFLLGSRPTTLAFASNEPGRLTVVVASPRGKSLATLKRKVKAGSGKIPLDGLLRHRGLRPGSYQLFVFATDAAGNTSRPVRLPFKILIG